MRVVLAPYGTLGDVRPLLALAIGLKRAGHEVLLCAPPETKSLAEEYNCPFRPLGSNFQNAAQEVPEPAMHRVRASVWVTRFLRQELQRHLSELPALVQGADVVIASSLNLAAHTVSEIEGCRYRFSAFAPQILPSRYHPSFFNRSHTLPHWYNRLTWNFSDLLWNQGVKPILNGYRKQFGLQPIENVVRHWLGDDLIIACDSILAPVPPDVGFRFVQTGYLHLPLKEQMSAALEDFIASGDPPVYIGFGSMINEHPQRTTEIILQAARRAGRRVVLSRGWGNLGEGYASADCFIADDAPHGFLFPRMCAVVHHGGSGTTATAARAGVPQVIVPHLADQFYWAHRIRTLGLGPEPIGRHELTVERLSSAIRRCADNGFRQRAQEIALLLQKQNPMAEALRALESY